MKTYDIEKSFVVMDGDKKATPETFAANFYENLDVRYGGFANCELVSCHSFESDWPSWEMHPNGDEIVILLSGAATFVLEMEALEEVYLDEAGAYIVVPAGTWHTAKVATATKMLFITPGQGTEHRSVQALPSFG